MTRSVGFALIAMGCAHPQVISLEAPDTACPGQPVEVRWQVDGRASLRVSRAEDDWDEGEVPPTGRRAIVTPRVTTLTVTALEATPEKKNAYRSRTIDVPRLDDDRAALATCDASGHCQGSFELPAIHPLRVVKLSGPTYRQGVVVQPTNVCVAPPGAARTCVAPETSAALDVAAGGKWTLESDLPPNTTPPELRIHLDLLCR
jgi:hypothetical protein